MIEHHSASPLTPAGLAKPGLPVRAVFLFDLLQDVSVLRPIILTLAEETGLAFRFLFSRQFAGRDKTQSWQAELAELAARCNAELDSFDDTFAAVRFLQGGRGLLFSASESNLMAHAVNHQVFLCAPAGYTRITVQHGHECVGFNQNYEQTRAHGSAVRFAADILCGWVPKEKLRHLCPSERDKYFELGPTMVLNRLHQRAREGETSAGMGLVCENLHSVRMRTGGNFQATYLNTLLRFAQDQGAKGRPVAVRPHPGGQFVIKNNVQLPANVTLANKPMFKTDLERMSYGISAPSSVLIDLVLAGIPTAVWVDADARLDTSGYAGLARVCTLEDWIAFADAATQDPTPFIRKQDDFLRRSGLDIKAEVIRDRLLRLVNGILRPETSGKDVRTVVLDRPPRLLLVANAVIPTLHISFLKPFEQLEKAGHIRLEVLTEKDVRQAGRTGKAASEEESRRYAISRIEQARPDMAVFCRYSGPEAQAMTDRLKKAGTPVVFHIDDDLLNIPEEIGKRKFIEHNKIERTSTVRYLIENADVVYCSTARLRDRLMEIGFDRDLYAGSIYCSREIVAPAELRSVRTIGFMGNDKTPELLWLAPVIARVLEKHPDIRFSLFGSTAMPPDLQGFQDRVSFIPPVSDYDQFVETFQQMEWDIGLCPLRPTPFNVVKADTKWVDYTSIGAAVIASGGTAYDRCCDGGCGILVDSLEEWEAALERLIGDPAARHAMVVTAQEKVRTSYSLDQLREQVLDVFDKASAA